MNLTGADQILNVAFIDGLPIDCLKSPQTLLKCPDWRLRLSGYYLELLWPRKPFSITILPSSSKVWEALDRGDLDVYLIGNPLDENLIKKVYATSMLYRSVDVMFTKQPEVSLHSENPIYFWVSCFTLGTWLCIFAVLILMLLTYLFVEKVSAGHVRKITSMFRPETPGGDHDHTHEQYLTTKRLLESCFLMFALLFTVYDSNVKAMIYTSSISEPFKNLKDLADQIRSGEKKMVLERKDTDRWRMLNNLNETNYESVKYLRNAVVEKNALSFIPDVRELCRQLSLNSRLVYFGSEKITESSCPEYCLWKFEMTEELAKPVYYVISKKTIRSGKLKSKRVNMFLHALHNYGDVVALRGHDKPDCQDNLVGATFIKFDSIVVVVYLMAILLSVAVAAFIGELIGKRLRGSGHVVIDQVIL